MDRVAVGRRVMEWKKNPEVPLSFEEQKEITKRLCAFGGTTAETMYADGMGVGYVTPELLKSAKKMNTLIGTACGKKDNQLSPKLCGMLLKAEHIVSLFFQREDEKDRLQIVALAVSGMGKKEANKMSKTAHNAGCSLRPDFVEICEKEWAFFESE